MREGKDTHKYGKKSKYIKFFQVHSFLQEHEREEEDERISL